MKDRKIERMPAPKHLTTAWQELPTEELKSVRYISVDALKEWIMKQAWEEFYKDDSLCHISAKDLLKFIDE